MTQTDMQAVQPSGEVTAEMVYALGKEESWLQGKTVDLAEVAEVEKGGGQVGGEYIKSFVFGGLDGICSTFALVAGLAGARIHIAPLIAVSLAKVLADAFSMGFGEYASANAELEASKQAKEKQIQAVESNRDAAAKDLLEHYKEEGCDLAHGLTIVSLLASYQDTFVEHSLAFRQGIFVEEDEDKWQTLKQGLVCAAAFAGFGLIPLVAFVIYYVINGGKSGEYGAVLGLAYAVTVCTLFTMGVTKAKLTGSSKLLKSGMIMVINGTFAGGAAYFLGECLSLAFGDV